MFITQKNRVEAFPDRLKLARLTLRLTQRIVAEKAGITVRCLQQYESGERNPRTPELVLLCEILKCTPNDLLGF